MWTLTCSQHFQSEDKQGPRRAAAFSAFLLTPQGSWSTAGVSYDTWICTRATNTTAEKAPDWADGMKVQWRDSGKDWLTGTSILMSQVKQPRRRVTHYKHNWRFAKRTTTKKPSKYLQEMRKRCRWKMKVPGYISLLRKNEKEGDCRDETLDSPCIHTHPPANTHYINQNNGSSREDPNYPAPSLTSSLEAARMCKGMKEKTYFSMRLLTAFSILPPLLQMCLLKQKKHYCSWVISVSDLKKKNPWKQRHFVLSISSGTII